jgi:hypothetical protein
MPSSLVSFTTQFNSVTKGPKNSEDCFETTYAMQAIETGRLENKFNIAIKLSLTCGCFEQDNSFLMTASENGMKLSERIVYLANVLLLSVDRKRHYAARFTSTVPDCDISADAPIYEVNGINPLRNPDAAGRCKWRQSLRGFNVAVGFGLVKTLH